MGKPHSQTSLLQVLLTGNFAWSTTIKPLLNISIPRYLRMTPQRFEHLLSLVAPLISKKSTKLRSSISEAERLNLTLRYLASGDSQQSQAFNFRIGRSTVSMIIRETCNAIWSQLREMYLPTPTNPEEWKQISEEFSTLWHFPHCIGAGDGKDVVIECRKNSGSNYFN